MKLLFLYIVGVTLPTMVGNHGNTRLINAVYVTYLIL